MPCKWLFGEESLRLACFIIQIEAANMLAIDKTRSTH
jgi:hypothetical protein